MVSHPGGNRVEAPGEAGAELLVKLAGRRDEFLAFLRSRTRSGSDIEDLLQQALLLATQKVSQLREPDLLVPWFYQILRRTLADHHTRWALREDRLRGLEAEVNAATPEEAVACACSLGLLQALPPRYAEVLRRVDVEDEPVASVADSLGTTVNNITVRLHRARKTLRGRLLSFCGTTSSRGCLDCRCGAGDLTDQV